MKNDLRWARFLISLKDPEGSEVDKVQGNNLTGAVSFPDFQIPSNPKYVKMFINNHFFLKKKPPGTFGCGAEERLRELPALPKDSTHVAI